jgi:hypothetical protein
LPAAECEQADAVLISELVEQFGRMRHVMKGRTDSAVRWVKEQVSTATVFPDLNDCLK